MPRHRSYLEDLCEEQRRIEMPYLRKHVTEIERCSSATGQEETRDLSDVRLLAQCRAVKWAAGRTIGRQWSGRTKDCASEGLCSRS